MPSLFSRLKRVKSRSRSASSDRSPPTPPRSKVSSGNVAGTAPVVTSEALSAQEGALDKDRYPIPDDARPRSPSNQASPARHAPPPANSQSSGLVGGAQDTSAPIQNRSAFPIIPSAVEALKPRPNVVNNSHQKEDAAAAGHRKSNAQTSSPVTDTVAFPQRSVRNVEGRKLRPAVTPSHQHESDEGVLGRASAGVLRDGTVGRGLDRTNLRRRDESLQAGTDTDLAHGVAGLSLGDKSKPTKSNWPVASTNGTGAKKNSAPATQAATLDSASSTTPPLEAQRKDLHDRISKEASAREASRTKLGPTGVQTFHAAGIGHLADKKGSINLYTKWLKPVVQEVIRPIVHTETFTIIERHLHIHHIYPKIQPISDPNPEVIATRHRIFSPQTGRWHEVVGDDAAREILGDNVFENGPKEVRHIRRQAHEVTDEERYEGTSKAKSRASRGLSDDNLLSQGQGRYTRAVEREYKVGEDTPNWISVPFGRVFGTHRRRDDHDSIGVAL